MKKIKNIILLSLLTVLLISCQNNTQQKNIFENGKLKVVTSFTILEDMVKAIGQDLVSVYNLVPTGTAPHEYEPLPLDNKAVTEAELLIYNGLNLEGGDEGWFFKLVRSSRKNLDEVFQVSDGVTPMYLRAGEKDEQINPHAFLDPEVGIIMTNNILKILGEIDPANQVSYQKNAQQYLSELQMISTTYQEKISALSPSQKVFVASEHAFQYMTERYGLTHYYIWEIDTDEIGSPQQIRELIDQLNKTRPPVLFVESNVQTKPMEQVSKETGIPIFSKKIYADEIGKAGSEVDTYLKFLTHNLNVIIEGLTSGGN